MVRLFIKNASGIFLLLEIGIPSVVKSNLVATYMTVIALQLAIEPGMELLVSSENSDAIVVMGEFITWSNCNC